MDSKCTCGYHVTREFSKEECLQLLQWDLEGMSKPVYLRLVSRPAIAKKLREIADAFERVDK